MWMLTAVLILAAGVVVSVGMMYMRMIALQQRVAQQDELLHRLRQDTAALCSGASGVANRIVRIEKDLRDTASVQQQAVVSQPQVNDRTYQHAIRLVSRGASIEEIVETCGLSKSEAELLSIVHGYQDKVA